MTKRLPCIFEDADELVLLQQCQADLATWGFDSFACQNIAARILQEAKAAVLTETVDAQCSQIAATRDGVTAEDAQWFGSLPPLARAVMRRFDLEILVRYRIESHCFHLCMEDLDRDVQQSLPTFGYSAEASDDNAPLPWELRPRFIGFMDKTRQDEQAWSEWNKRCRRASSMNALIREEIRAGRL